MNHRYLITLEITPVKVGKTYGDLPSHLTLMSRFFSDLGPNELAEILKPLFVRSKPVHISVSKTTKLGPKKLTVHLMEHSAEIISLHNELRAQLDLILVSYEYPQFIGNNYTPHITQRHGQIFRPGDSLLATHCYLIEIIVGERVIKSRFKFAA